MHQPPVSRIGWKQRGPSRLGFLPVGLLRGCLLCALVIGLTGLVGCGEARNPTTRLRLATTTSTENSGLLDEILPLFERDTGIEVQVISMGTGKALATGERGDCDVLLVHAPEAERAFVERGFGTARHPVMYNDFVILGPAEDPAKARGSDAAEALQRIARAGSAFCSRGDDSGTHKKERALWREAGVEPESSAAGYSEGGGGMGATLTQASERRAYTLSDRGTYLAYRGRLDLVVLVEGSEHLKNPYSIVAVSSAKHAHVNEAGADKLVAWITSSEAQQRIGAFQVRGEVLFHPDARR